MLTFLSHHSSSKLKKARPNIGRELVHHTLGFTLIELLVVIGIIGLLAGVVLVSLNSARVKSRDTQRAKDLETLQAAIEVYFSDYGHYPITSPNASICPWGGNCYASFDSPAYSPVAIIGTPSAANLTEALVPKYIASPLKDPSRASGDAGYLYRSDATGGSYCILFWETPENMKSFAPERIDMGRCGSVGSDGQCSNPGSNNVYYSSAGATGC